MFDILLYLFESYFDIGSYPEPNRLSAKLTAAGFEEDDISQALTWLSGLRELSHATYPERINRSGLRCYTDFEAERMSEDGLRFIAFWELNKIITPIEREMIVDRVVALGRVKLSIDKVKLIALMVLWNQHEDIDPLLIEDLLSPSETAQLH
jgi:Smg protein